MTDTKADTLKALRKHAQDNRVLTYVGWEVKGKLIAICKAEDRSMSKVASRILAAYVAADPKGSPDE